MSGNSYTEAQCIAKIQAIQEAIDELALLPRAGVVGKTELDMRGKLAELEGQLDLWRKRLRAARNGGIYEAVRRIC